MDGRLDTLLIRVSESAAGWRYRCSGAALRMT